MQHDTPEEFINKRTAMIKGLKDGTLQSGVKPEIVANQSVLQARGMGLMRCGMTKEQVAQILQCPIAELEHL